MENKKGILDRSVTPQSFKKNLILFTISIIYFGTGIASLVVSYLSVVGILIGVIVFGAGFISFFGLADASIKKIFNQS